MLISGSKFLIAAVTSNGDYPKTPKPQNPLKDIWNWIIGNIIYSVLSRLPSSNCCFSSWSCKLVSPSWFPIDSHPLRRLFFLAKNSTFLPFGTIFSMIVYSLNVANKLTRQVFAKCFWPWPQSHLSQSKRQLLCLPTCTVRFWHRRGSALCCGWSSGRFCQSESACWAYNMSIAVTGWFWPRQSRRL